MNRKSKVALFAAALTITGGVAAAATSVVGVPHSSMDGVPNAVATDGSLKANAVGHNQIKVHSITKSQLAFGLSVRGPRGFRGLTGATGATGITGATGPIGPIGPSGVGGPHGTQGLPGPVGPAGPQGEPGTAAAKGDKGDKGDPGATGLPGATVIGPQGNPGPTGATGPAGPKGDKGATGDTGLTGPKGDNGSPGAAGLNGAKGDKGDQGLQGPGGTPGTPGAPGPTGSAGPKGDKGDVGNTGPQGAQGVPGTPAPTVDYGIVNVQVQRGSGAATTWAQYTSDLGSPVGGSTGGSFRFTCSTANAPCHISVQAAVEGQDNTKTHTFYPRLVVTRDGDGNGGGSISLTACEYADGATNANPFVTLTDQGISPTPTFTGTTLGIGGSYDCDPGNTFFGSAQPAGDVATLEVPNGYYDVNGSFAFGPKS